MRVLFDTNLYISVLLNPQPSSLSSALVRRALAEYSYSCCPRVWSLRWGVRLPGNPYLNQRINADDARHLLSQIEAAAEIIDISSVRIERNVRDPNDDFLIASALKGDADYLVTWDNDLLILDGHVEACASSAPHSF